MATSNRDAAAVPKRNSPQTPADALSIKPSDLGLGNAASRLVNRVGQKFGHRLCPVSASVKNRLPRKAIPGVLCGDQFPVYQNQAVGGEAFSQSHVVRQTPAESELPQEVYPAQAVFLVRAKFSVELLGRVGGFDAVEALQFVAG